MRGLPPIALAIAAVIGFGIWQIVDSLLNYLLYPFIHYATGLDLRDLHVALRHDPLGDPLSDTIFFGPLLTEVLATLVAGLILFMAFRWLWEEASDGEAECPYCLSLVPAEAVKCAYCTSELPALAMQDET